MADLARMYGKSTSTISSILAKKKEIKEADVAKGVNVLMKQRSQTIKDVEKLLLVWINEKQLAGDSVSEAIICEKARLLHADLAKKMPGTSAAVSEFKAGRGWFDKFKKRTGIHSVVRHGEAASSDKRGAEEFVDEFKEYVEAEGFLPQQVFNCDETGLFWKKMPKRTYIMQDGGGFPFQTITPPPPSPLLAIFHTPTRVFNKEEPRVEESSLQKSALKKIQVYTQEKRPQAKETSTADLQDNWPAVKREQMSPVSPCQQQEQNINAVGAVTALVQPTIKQELEEIEPSEETFFDECDGQDNTVFLPVQNFQDSSNQVSEGNPSLNTWQAEASTSSQESFRDKKPEHNADSAFCEWMKLTYLGLSEKQRRKARMKIVQYLTECEEASD